MPKRGAGALRSRAGNADRSGTGGPSSARAGDVRAAAGGERDQARHVARRAAGPHPDTGRRGRRTPLHRSHGQRSGLSSGLSPERRSRSRAAQCSRASLGLLWRFGPSALGESARRRAGFAGVAMRVVIVDDEAPARARLRQLLAAHPDVEIVGEADTGVRAMEIAAESRPDTLLLDIQMPGCSGIDVAASLCEPRPHVIFCTAYDQHAVDAFELHAVDYLLKPISRARLAQALERVRSAAVPAPPLRAMGPSRFLVRNATHYQVIAESKVLYFCSEDGLTKLVGEAGQYWMDPTLNELEQQLDPSRFFRISRAALIHLSTVTEVHPMPADPAKSCCGTASGWR